MSAVQKAEKEAQMQQTKGQYRVGITFNPSGNEAVDEINRKAADLIDTIERHCQMDEATSHAQAAQQGEILRLKALAQTDAENAAMWAVKALTKPVPT